MAVAELSTDRLSELLGDDADDLLSFSSPAVSKDLLHLPGPDFVDRVNVHMDRNPQVLRDRGVGERQEVVAVIAEQLAQAVGAQLCDCHDGSFRRGSCALRR